LTHIQAPKVAKNGIYQTSDKDLSKPEIKDKKSQFGLLIWYLDNRISTTLAKCWASKSFQQKKQKKEVITTKETFNPLGFIFKSKPKKNYNETIDEQKILNLTEMGFSYKVAYYALTEAKDDLVCLIFINVRIWLQIL
jgi:hypothetical protein